MIASGTIHLPPVQPLVGSSGIKRATEEELKGIGAILPTMSCFLTIFPPKFAEFISCTTMSTAARPESLT